MPGADKTPEQWPAEARLAAIIETATLSATELAEYCRKKGLYPEQIQQWKQAFLQVPARDDKAALKQSRKENKQLKRELARKEKTLAEAGSDTGFAKDVAGTLRDGQRGRLTRVVDRQLIRDAVCKAVEAGARLTVALNELPLSLRT
ncbi:transcriptional regulator [Xenorhabdus kozodoii]|uniref:Transcriptional regulator n=1 Tax=Xenorhabdus kozodoii TaxID=351676 RepID=A0A2D0KXM0_9GAMM|nr:transcriptional regulator [Xenorhabdus kozodoii]